MAPLALVSCGRCTTSGASTFVRSEQPAESTAAARAEKGRRLIGRNRFSMRVGLLEVEGETQEPVLPDWRRRVVVVRVAAAALGGKCREFVEEDSQVPAAEG